MRVQWMPIIFFAATILNDNAPYSRLKISFIPRKCAQVLKIPDTYQTTCQIDFSLSLTLCFSFPSLFRLLFRFPLPFAIVNGIVCVVCNVDVIVGIAIVVVIVTLNMIV